MNIRCCAYVHKKFLFSGIAVISGFACRFPPPFFFEKSEKRPCFLLRVMLLSMDRNIFPA